MANHNRSLGDAPATTNMMMPNTATVVNARTWDHPRRSGLATTESTSPTVSSQLGIRSWFAMFLGENV